MDLPPENNGIHSLVPSKSSWDQKRSLRTSVYVTVQERGKQDLQRKRKRGLLKKKKKQVSTLKWNNFCSFHSGEKRTSQVETLPGVLVCGMTLSLHHPHPKN